VSEQLSEPTSIETGSVSGAADAKIEPIVTESPAIAPDQEMTSPTADAPKVEPKIEPPKVEAPKVEMPKIEMPKIEMPKAEKKAEAPRPSGNVTIMAPGAEAAPKRRVAAMAAVVALAAVAGAIGGALATTGLGHGNATDAVPTRNAGLEAAISRIDADILALKASVEQNARLGVTQLNKTTDRLDKVEKAQAEPAAKLAKLSDEVGKLRAAQAAGAAPPAAAAPAPAAPMQVAVAPAVTTVPKDVTGSVAPPAAAATPLQTPGAAAKADLGRLPTVEGWVLRDVGRGSALIESRRGLYEVYAGDPVPGLGRVDAIRKQDGRWVVVTSKGLIVSR
jgi:hypothetical protein